MIDLRDSYMQPKASILAISREFGCDHIEVHNNSITKCKFKCFLENLRRKYPFEDIILMMDNLSLHRSNEVRERMDELGFLYCWTPVYSPQYNGVEEVINIGKQKIKKERLEALLKDR